MKPPPGKKLFAFIITVMMFSTIPQLASAQKNKPCPQGYKQECHYYVCPLCARGTWICTCVPNANGKNVTYNSTSHQSIAKSFELEHRSIVSIKIYDATERLVRTLADSRMPERGPKIYDMSGRLARTLADEIFQKGEHEMIWNTAEVNEGIYLINIGTTDASENNKVVVLK